ncbi:hypothetical protein [Cellulosimicrobium sp. Marseille-Q4280]|uniref:hypothetical protein n=1 Tax=Cellulosimicrobium sp. Marseille-Q4280 TaxID=2937992 RepID=UPI00204228E2|nr:hypothetical protein [Cellulosimicrobium sp. Marseille-Q4280]
MSIETAAFAADQTQTYHVVLGDGRDSVAENGPHPSATAALSFAASVMGKTVDEILALPGSDELNGVEAMDRRVVGYTIERYTETDGTDGGWMLNGGIKPALVAA